MSFRNPMFTAMLGVEIIVSTRREGEEESHDSSDPFLIAAVFRKLYKETPDHSSVVPDSNPSAKIRVDSTAPTSQSATPSQFPS